MLLLGDCNDWLKEINDNSIDLITTDPPYGIEFMGKDWDKALVSTDTWKECYRVLKPGKLAFIMCSPRQDVLARMIIHLQDAGFRTNYTSIYWTYASGFPKAANVSKLIDKREGAEREIIGQNQDILSKQKKDFERGYRKIQDSYNAGAPTRNNGFITLSADITKPATEEAKKMEGAYVGFQPKPAVEVILVVSKGKTLTWLDDCRIPYQSEDDKDSSIFSPTRTNFREYSERMGYDKLKKELPEVNPPNEKGRFPANLLVSDDILNDGKITKSSKGGFKGKLLDPSDGWNQNSMQRKEYNWYNDEGSYSRYFDLDAWSSKTFPFIITPKASKSERNKGLDDIPDKFVPVFEETKLVRVNEPEGTEIGNYLKSWRLKQDISVKELASHFPSKTGGLTGCVWNWEQGVNIPTKEEWEKLKEILQFDDKHDKQMTEFIELDKEESAGHTKFPQVRRNFNHNHHPTVKPLKLMSYLITMGSREGDLVLDPFCGSGTVCIAADNLHRKWIGIEKNEDYAQIIKKRLMVPLSQLKMEVWH